MKTLKYIKINPKAVYESRVVVQGNSNPMSPSIAIMRNKEHPLSRYSLNVSNQSINSTYSMMNSFRSNHSNSKNNIYVNRDNFSDRSFSSKALQLPLATTRKALLLDLDETLIHSTQFKLPKTISNYTLYISFDSIQPKQNIYVYVRPYLNEFLEKMAKVYDLMIFTASQPSYANPIIDLIDPNKLIKARFFRPHCKLINGSLVKDINIANRSLNNVIIVDNSPSAYFLQCDNGIPIESWTGDNKDTELFKLIGMLEYLSEVNNVREYIKLFVDKDQICYAKYFMHRQKAKTPIKEQQANHNNNDNNKEEGSDTINSNKGTPYNNKDQLQADAINKSRYLSHCSYLPVTNQIKASLLKCKKKMIPFSLIHPANRMINTTNTNNNDNNSNNYSTIIRLPVMKSKCKSEVNIFNNKEENCFLQDTIDNDLPVLKRSISKVSSNKDLFSYKLRKYTDQQLSQRQYESNKSY